MSLQNIAQHLANQGRGKDTTLVHMTPNEVSGLAALARANGKEISVNPQTGLPEAYLRRYNGVYDVIFKLFVNMILIANI